MQNNLEQTGDLFSTVAREPTLASQVAEQLEELIVENRLQAGDRLPSERELGRRFGVSRTVIREAVRVLMAKNLLEIVHGGGTVVRSPSPHSIGKAVALMLRLGDTPINYDKVNEVRRLLEVEIVGLAAERRTADDLAKLESIVDAMAEIQADREQFAENDVAFHVALAEATHNELFVVLLDSLADVMLKVRQTGFEAPGAPAHAMTYHRRIFEQVRDENVAEARHVMAEHLDMSEKIFSAALDRLLNESSG
jgi:GntR family transcriptional repressor for pyruvate dehydrogenase complex